MDAGDIAPVRQASCFPASEVGAAIKCMQTGHHIGKILVRMPHQSDLSGLNVKPSPLPMTFSPEHSYLLAGGLGGVGRALSTWMVEQGARYFTYLSPHAGQTIEHQAFLDELAVQGCQAVAVVGQAENMQDVQTAIAQSARPVRGMIQLALDLKVRVLHMAYGVIAHRSYRTPVYRRWPFRIGTPPMHPKRKERGISTRPWRKRHWIFSCSADLWLAR